MLIRCLFITCLLLLSTLLKAAPQRIVSLNLCTDQYLLLLADPQQIASISYLSKDPEYSYYADRAAQFPVNYARPEQVIARQPDLILSGRFNNWTTSQMLTRAGFTVELIDHPQTLTAVFQQLRQVGTLIGQSERAEQVVSQMQQRLAALAKQVPEPNVNTPSLMQYSAGGFTVGPETLTGELIRLSGWRNSAEQAGIRRFGRLDLESLLRLKPDRLIDVPDTASDYSAAEQLLRHPVLKKAKQPGGWIWLDQKLWSCGGPMLIDAIEQLKQAREQVEQSADHPQDRRS